MSDNTKSNNTVEILFSLLSFEMGGEYRRDPAELLDDMTLAKVCELADFHDLVHLIANALARLSVVPKSEKLANAISQKQLRAILRAERADSELSAVSELFESEGIDFIPLKGAVLRELYPERWMRTSGDVDVLVREDDVNRAAELLCQKLSYVFEGNGGHDLQLKSPSGVPFELHFRLVDDGFAAEPLDRVWDYTASQADNSHRKSLTDEIFVFYHLVHMAKHIRNGGCGIKPLLDLLALKQSGKLDVSTELMKKHGTDRLFEVSKRLVRVWFEGESHDGLTKSLEDYILRAGVYGNLQNAVAAGKAKNGGKLGNLLARAFLPYDVMKYMYPILKKHKWLLPFCHVARWFGALFGGRGKRAINELKLNSAAPKNTAEVSNLLSDLGLT